MGHVIRTWSSICSIAPQSQFGEGARPHLCINKWNRPTPVRKRLSLTQAVWGKLIPTVLALVLSMKTRSLDVFPRHSAFHPRVLPSNQWWHYGRGDPVQEKQETTFHVFCSENIVISKKKSSV